MTAARADGTCNPFRDAARSRYDQGMRYGTSIALLALLVPACGPGKPAPKEGADTTSLEGDAGAPATATGSDAGPADEKPNTSVCTGFDLDLNKVLYQAACEVPKAPEKSMEIKGKLEVKVSAPKTVAAGKHADLTITFVNKTAAELPLYFVVDPEPRFSTETFDAKGGRADMPTAAEPALPDSVANAPRPEAKAARVVLVGNGKATVTIPWDAVKTKWAPKEKVKGAIPGRGYPREPAGPLGKGKYSVKLVTPLTAVFEGIDHEVSQPRVEIEVTP